MKTKDSCFRCMDLRFLPDRINTQPLTGQVVIRFNQAQLPGHRFAQPHSQIIHRRHHRPRRHL
jgi:hypothetical protein